MQHSTTLFVGLDIHKEAISVAYIAGDQGAEVVCPTPAHENRLPGIRPNCV